MNSLKEQNITNPVKPVELQRHDKTMKFVLLAIATLLTTLGLVATGYLLFKLTGIQPFSYPLNASLEKSNQPQAVNTTLPPQISTLQSVPNPLIQPALANKAQVELLSVKRIPGLADQVSVELRITRLANSGLTKIDQINPQTTTARQPITNETYKAVDPQHRASKPIALLNLPKGQPIDGYVVLKIPTTQNTIDIFVDNTNTFRNISIANN
jgi:hypothetical protein